MDNNPKEPSTLDQVMKPKRKRKRKSKSKIPKEGKITLLNPERHKEIMETLYETQPLQSSPATFRTDTSYFNEYPELGNPVSSAVTSYSQATKKRLSSTPQKIKTEKQEDLSKLDNTPSQPAGGKSIRKPKEVPTKKTKTPMELNIMDIIKKAAEIQLSTKSGDSSEAGREKFVIRKEKTAKKNLLNPHNILDSTAPVMKRGKEREEPKPSKLTPLKKVILNERQKRKQVAMETQNSDELSQAPDIAMVVDLINTSRNHLEEASAVLDTEALLKEELDSAESFDAMVEVDARLSADSDSEIIDTALVGMQMSSFIPKDSISEVKQEQSHENPERRAEDIEHCVNLLLHNRKYREYCTQSLSAEIDELMRSVLSNLVRFQDRAYHKDPIKAKIKKRMISGLREVGKYAKSGKLKFLIVAPDVERIDSLGGLTDVIKDLINVCHNSNVEVVFGLPRRKLGHVCKKHVSLSCIGILNYEGTDQECKKMLELVAEARRDYAQLVENIEKKLTGSLVGCLREMNASDPRIELIRKRFWSEFVASESKEGC